MSTNNWYCQASIDPRNGNLGGLLTSVFSEILKKICNYKHIIGLLLYVCLRYVAH